RFCFIKKLTGSAWSSSRRLRIAVLAGERHVQRVAESAGKTSAWLAAFRGALLSWRAHQSRDFTSLHKLGVRSCRLGRIDPEMLPTPCQLIKRANLFMLMFYHTKKPCQYVIDFHFYNIYGILIYSII
ncbi:MAG: hypothetical protein NTW46_02400, partial [Candidatus Nealsonbacteria bacterium]|nr:hypothetical protein [Candidatus Nealsonbacteria bacterium]